MQCFPPIVYSEMSEAAELNVRKRDLDAPMPRCHRRVPTGVSFWSFLEAEQRRTELVLVEGEAGLKSNAVQMKLRTEKLDGGVKRPGMRVHVQERKIHAGSTWPFG